jgi:hypothetical protein
MLNRVASPPLLLAAWGGGSMRFEFTHQLIEYPGQP